MTGRVLLAISLLAGGLLLTPLASAQSVTGALTDAQNTVALAGAIIRVDGMQKSATTDNSGRFRLSNVPAGKHTLVVSYVGVPDKRIPIDVPAEGLAMGNVSIGGEGGTGVTEELIVYGQAAALAGGINQERSADNLKSVLDTDAMGQFPDQNVAESLRRLSGVTVENDQGEGRYVVIRGMDPDLNSTSINGVAATAAEPRRALQLDVIPSDVLDGLEINKTLSADMDGDAIGGAINVKTLSAFSRKGFFLKSRVEGSYNELREEWSPKASIAGSNIFDLGGDRRFGVAAAISWNDRKLQVDNNEGDDWEVADNGSEFQEEFQPRLYTIERERIGGVLNFDLDVSDSTALHLYTLYSKFTDNELRDRLTFGLGGLDEATVTNASADYSEAELERDTKDREQTAENFSLSLGSATQLNAWLLESNFGYAFAKEETPDQVEAVWVAEFESGDGIITDGVPVLTLNRNNPKIPRVETGFWAALQDDSLYELDEIENKHEVNKDNQLSLKLDATRETGFGSIKAGLKGRWREKKTNEDREIFSGDGTFFLSDVVSPNGGSDYGLPTPINPVASPSGVREILANGIGIDFEDIDSEIDSNNADFVYEENIYAAYGMATWETGRAQIIGGLRVEYTDIDNSGNSVELIEEGEIVNGVPLTEDTVFVTPIQQSRNYTDLLPSAALKFDFTEQLVGRASFFKAVVRPRTEEVAFRVAIEDNEAELGNPDLDPFSAWNIDASLAFYPTELSVISAGVFYKKIQDFIFVQVLDDFEFEGRVFDEAAIALNGKDADVLGFEFNYQQHFGFLGAPFDAFLVGVNYTYVDSEADTGERKVDLPKQSKNIASVLVGYDKHGVDIRLAMKYRDRYVDELDEPGLDRYIDDHLQWDLTAKYRFTDSWQVYAEIANLGARPEYYYAGNKRQLLQYDDIGTTSAIGIQYNFQ